MHVLAPAFLYALPAMAIPVIIYLIFRRRRRDVRWGAIYILRRVMESRSRAAAWVQYLVLALRTLALGLIVLLFALPYRSWEGIDEELPPPPPGTHRLIVLDVSASMRARYGQGTAADGAFSLLRRLVESVPAPGTVEILPADGRATPVVFDTLPATREAVETALIDLAALRHPLELSAALRTATARLRMSPYARREVILLSDFSARDFPRDRMNRLARQVEALEAQGVALHAVAFRDDGLGNVAVTDFSTVSDAALANQATLFRCRLQYFGNDATRETRLQITDEQGRALHSTVVAVGREPKTVEIPLSLHPGRRTLTASVTPDDLEADDTLTRTVRVLPEAHIIILQNLNDRTGFDDPRHWLAMALARKKEGAEPPPGTKRPTSAAEAYRAHGEAIQKARQTARSDALRKPYELQIEGKIPEQVSDALLTFADLVIVQDVDTLGREGVEALEHFVLRGGTVLFTPGVDTQPARFNETFGRLLPGTLGPRAKKEIDPAVYEQCFVEAGDDRLLRQLESPAHGNLASARFYNGYALTLADAPEVRTLLALSNGAPLLAERARGRGRVLLWTAGLGGDWHSMVVHPAYPVFLIQLARQAAARRLYPVNLEPGAPILLEAAGAQARVVRPDGTDEVVETVAVGERWMLRYDKTESPGTYDVRFDLASEQPGILFHVSGDYAESDLRPLAGPAREDFTKAWGGSILAGPKALREVLAATYPGAAQGGGLWAGALLLLAVAAGLMWRFFA